MLSVLNTLCCHVPLCYFHPSFSPLNVSNSLTHHISLRFSPLLVFCHVQLLPRPTLLPISPCVPALSFSFSFFFFKKKKTSPTVNKLTSCGQPSLLSLLLKGSRKKGTPCWRRRDLFSAEAEAHVPFDDRGCHECTRKRSAA